jgi:ABC-type nitrate/sulfonate/bicarbonate transport system permease component
MRLGLTVSLILAVIGEMLASEFGLGFHILQAARAYQSDRLFAGVILLGAIGLVSNLALQAAEWHILRWRRR